VTSAALTSFVARESELALLEPLLSEARLLTLAGPGGIGKTRLALALSERLTQLFDQRVWFASVANLAEPHLVPQAVASALGIGDAADRAVVHAIVDKIGSSTGLLVLDNCEHLLDSCAQLVEVLLRSCPQLHILALFARRHPRRHVTLGEDRQPAPGRNLEHHLRAAAMTVSRGCARPNAAAAAYAWRVPSLGLPADDALQKRPLRTKPEQELANVLVVRAPRLELLGYGMHIAEAPLERPVLEYRIRAGQTVDAVHHGRGLVGGMRGCQPHGYLLLDVQHARARHVLPDLRQRLLQVCARRAQPSLGQRHRSLDRCVFSNRAFHAARDLARGKVFQGAQAGLRNAQPN
jgi:hypothetical protein